jgi:Fe-S-cluster containining protein
MEPEKLVYERIEDTSLTYERIPPDVVERAFGVQTAPQEEKGSMVLACRREQAEGNGPCGACADCCKRELDSLRASRDLRDDQLKAKDEQLRTKDEHIKTLKDANAAALQRLGPHNDVLATTEQLKSATLRNLKFRLVDLADEYGNVKGKSIENCVIYGPAVLFPGRFLEIQRSSLGAPSVESAFFEVPSDQKGILGVVRVEETSIINSRFEGVSFIGPRPLIEYLKKGFGLSQPGESQK